MSPFSLKPPVVVTDIKRYSSIRTPLVDMDRKPSKPRVAVTVHQTIVRSRLNDEPPPTGARPEADNAISGRTARRCAPAVV